MNSKKILSAKSFKIHVANDHLESLCEASTLLLSCVDFRLRDVTEKLMRVKFKLLGDYDEVAIPGASLSLENSKYPHWRQTVLDIIGMLKLLHGIKRVILLDHRECGAYKLVLGDEHRANREVETETHAHIMLDAKLIIQKHFPDLEVYTFLMGLDGVVEHITEANQHKNMVGIQGVETSS